MSARPAVPSDRLVFEIARRATALLMLECIILAPSWKLAATPLLRLQDRVAGELTLESFDTFLRAEDQGNETTLILV